MVFIIKMGNLRQSKKCVRKRDFVQQTINKLSKHIVPRGMADDQGFGILVFFQQLNKNTKHNNGK
jgi:hypothetical protein